MPTVTKILAAAGAAGLCLVAGSAIADKYNDLARSAQGVESGDVAGLFWSATVDCGKSGDDLARRQCEGVRAARAQVASGGSYVASGDSLAFEVGAWDAQKGGLPLTVYGCIACDKAVDVNGQARFLVTKGDVKIEGGALRGPVVHKAVRKFKSEADAKKWKDTVVPRLRTQFVFKLPERPTEWTTGGNRGFGVEMVGFRVWDPCDGAVVCANPPSEAEKADRAACKGGAASGTEIAGGGEGGAGGASGADGGGAPKPMEKKPDAPVVPERLSSEDIKKSMTEARTKVDACFAKYGVPGKADVTMVVATDGAVKKVELRGEFQGTPTGDCMTQAIQDVKFPAFRAGPVTLKYPFILR